MKSLTAKLMLAFLLVGLIGVGLVSLLVSARTRSEFDRFLSERDRSALVEALGNYYSARGSWEGVETMLENTPSLAPSRRLLVLVDAQGLVVLANRELGPGMRIRIEALNQGLPIEVEGQRVGTLLLPTDGGRPGNRPSPEEEFLARISSATITSALVATAIALLLGAVLAQTLTRPLRELIAATKTLARGTFDHRVKVRSQDEIGQLAASFNQMSADLARASQLRKQMTADLAHDLRTPLSILRGYTEGLKDERLVGSAPVYSIMHEEVEQLQRLVDDLRVLSLADAGELSLNRRAVDPQALLERTGLAYFVQAEEQGLELKLEPAEELPSVEVDTDRMAQVLKNLVANALRHTSEGGITLAAAACDQRVELRVSDTGSGIDAEDLPFIFDRFYRADKARSRGDVASSGLGLAIAKAIVEAHGGTIGVESARGQGTTFTIALPAGGHPQAGTRVSPK